jgi:hypothetical protein
MNELFQSNLNIKLLDAEIQGFASAFHCGNTHIDSFLRSRNALDPGLGCTYVWLEENNTEIIGFYNICTGAIDQVDNYGVRRKMGGAVHINEFALEEKYHGQTLREDDSIRLSDLLLSDCLERIQYLRQHHLGFAFVTLQSTKEGESLYSRNDFEVVESDMSMPPSKGEEDCIPMYLALDLE